jgi:hypothetical protein
MIHWEYSLSIPPRAPCKPAASGFLKGVLLDLRWPRMAQHESAGCLVYRIVEGVVQFLLVHPSGASFRKRLFGLPKVISGEVDEKGNTSHDWEVDVSKFYPLVTCRRIIHPDQEVFLDRALELLSTGDASTP